MRRVTCVSCGRSFEEDVLEYLGGSHCPSCRPRPQSKVVAAEKEMYRACLEEGMNSNEAARKANEFAREVARKLSS